MSGAVEPVIAYLRTQAEVIATRADDVRTDEPDAVHRSRVATRRARSALRTFAPLFRGTRVRALRDELAWHADHLGAPRDAEVLKERLLATLETLPRRQVTGPIRKRLSGALDEAHALAHDSLVGSMATDRYDDLREALLTFVTEPPLRNKAATRKSRHVASLLDATVERVRRLALRAADLPDDLHLWHEVRKNAKAARYCSEALTDAFDGAETRAQAWERVTEALGEVQDTVVAEQTLIRHAAMALAEGEPVEPYLALERLELSQRTEALATGRRALDVALGLPELSSSS